mmetsp:Transcript_11978/g.26249  ORF Transcript_11978/g.26249 Transcript_11978/m.26249 type:complete len:140 (+) Transcript_11978:65-484(+)
MCQYHLQEGVKTTYCGRVDLGAVTGGPELPPMVLLTLPPPSIVGGPFERPPSGRAGVTFPMLASGSGYLDLELEMDMILRLAFGGAIRACSGSLVSDLFPLPFCSDGCGAIIDVGGGGSGFAFSFGSSPGKTQHPASLS